MTRVPSTEVLRLEVADDPTGLVNLVVNPNGDLGGWGWVTPVAGSKMTGNPDDTTLTYYSTVAGAQTFYTEDMPITAGWYAAARWRTTSASLAPPSNGLWIRADMQWINAAGAVISSSTPGPWIDCTSTDGTYFYGPNVSPAGAVKFRFRISFARDATGAAITGHPFSLNFDQVSVATAATSGELGTMKVNYVPDPSFEAVPITTNWSPSGPNVGVAQASFAGLHGTKVAVLHSTAVAPVRTNLVRNPNLDHGAITGWSAGTSHTTVTLDPSAPGTSGGGIKMAGDGTARVVTVQTHVARFIPVSVGEKLAVQLKTRFGSSGGGWTNDVTTVLGIYWTDGSGALFGSGTLSGLKTIHSEVNDGSIQQGNWWTLSGVITVPAGVAGVRIVLSHTLAGKNILASMGAWADNIMLEKAASVGTYFDGDTLASGDNPDYQWTSTIGDSTSTATTRLATTTTPGVLSSEFAVRGGRDLTASAGLAVSPGSAPPVEFKAELRWYDASHNPMIPPTTVLSLGTVALSDGWTRRSASTTAPPVAAFARIAVYPVAIGVFDTPMIDAVQVEPGSTLGPFIVGEVTTGGLPFIPPVTWVNILGATHDISIVRQSLNTGTMTASVLDANLDPSRAPLLRPGRACRLMALPWGADDDGWQPLFTGALSQAEVAYDPQVPAPQRAKITLTAVDALARLANISRAEGVGTVDELPYVLEGCGVPWDCNTSGNQVASATVVARNENASALDQVAITRDSALGFAWLDRLGVLHVYDDPGLYVGWTTTLDESTYSDTDISFNTGQAINEVNVAYQRYNPDTGETEDVPYGPYVDTASVDEWGPLSADFRIQGITEDAPTLQAFADAVLAANANPVRRINSVLIPIKSAEDIRGDLALLDLENLTGVTNLASDLMDNLRIQSIEHRITTTRWTMLLGFGVNGAVASPSFTPAPGNTGGVTLSQLLRPVGEVTMFYGALADVPAGWLPMTGGSFSATDYPELAARIGGTTLPDMTDRFPIGAGTKSLGTVGGNPTKTLALANLPAHHHTINGHNHDIGFQWVATTTAGGTTDRVTDIDNQTGGGGTAATATTAGSGTLTSNDTGTGTALDVMNPWRSLWFIIRAR